jgi:hypothetical protein
MGQMHRVLAMAVLLGLGIVALSLLGAGAQRGSGEVAQMQRVEPAAVVATTQVGTPPPVRTPPTPPPGVTISTPVVVPTPTFAGPLPTRDPRTPIPPTVQPVLVTPSPTRRPLTPAPTHTPGPRPTNPPGEEQALRSLFAAALQDRQARGQLAVDAAKVRLAINSVRIMGDWAYIGFHGEPVSGTPIAGGGSIAIARKLNGQWQIAFPTDSEFRAWLDSMPDSLLTPQQRQWI